MSPPRLPACLCPCLGLAAVGPVVLSGADLRDPAVVVVRVGTVAVVVLARLAAAVASDTAAEADTVPVTAAAGSQSDKPLLCVLYHHK